MLVDIGSQQQLSEVFSANHCSHKRNSTTTIATMTNGQRYVNDDLGKKANQILGLAPAVVDYRRQPSIDCARQCPPRLIIPDSTSREHPVLPKDKIPVSIDQLIPLIAKLVAPLPYSKLPETISYLHSSKTAVRCSPKQLNSLLNSREVIEDDTHLNLSDEDENDVIDGDENQNEIQHSNSETENDDELNQTNPHTLSLMDFLPAQHSSATLDDKRTLSPSTSVKPTKRKEELIRSFSSSVNIPIDLKQPALPITIPTYLFFQSEDEEVKSSKRYVNGVIKQETNTDTNETSIQPKRSKTSHAYVKEEPTIPFSDDTQTTGNTTTITPVLVPIKKEKPTANVKPLLQSTMMENPSSVSINPNAVNPPDRLTTTSAHSFSRTNYANLRTMSTKALNSLAREKKKQADGEKRTFEDVRKSMCLYLESVCYFIQCAHDEPILEQRNSLQTATLNMLQHLVYNYQKMFHIPINQSAELLNNIRQKFLLINYWLQSYIYHLQFTTNFSSIERCANQVTEYFSHSKSPVDVNHNFIYDFSKYMLNSYHSNCYWNKAERMMREEPSKKFVEQLTRQNQNRHLSRDHSTLDFLLYIFDAIDLLRTTHG